MNIKKYPSNPPANILPRESAQKEKPANTGPLQPLPPRPLQQTTLLPITPTPRPTHRKRPRPPKKLQNLNSRRRTQVDIVHCNTLQRTATRTATHTATRPEHAATHCNTQRHTEKHRDVPRRRTGGHDTLQHTLQRTTTRSATTHYNTQCNNTLHQYTATTHCNAQRHLDFLKSQRASQKKNSVKWPQFEAHR